MRVWRNITSGECLGGTHGGSRWRSSLLPMIRNA